MVGKTKTATAAQKRRMTRIKETLMPAYRDFEERFWEKVDIRGDQDCWNWTACKGANGYGRVRLSRQRKTGNAHRIAYELTYGETPEGHIVCHDCGNPSCCNPSHLYAGTCSDNMADRVRHGRQAGGARSGELHHCAKLTQAQVRAMRAMRKLGADVMTLSDRFGVSTGHVHSIITGKSWRHL